MVIQIFALEIKKVGRPVTHWSSNFLKNKKQNSPCKRPLGHGIVCRVLTGAGRRFLQTMADASLSFIGRSFWIFISRLDALPIWMMRQFVEIARNASVYRLLMDCYRRARVFKIKKKHFSNFKNIFFIFYFILFYFFYLFFFFYYILVLILIYFFLFLFYILFYFFVFIFYFILFFLFFFFIFFLLF